MDYKIIFENQPECVKLLAVDGSLLEMNPAGLRMVEADSFAQVANRCVYPLVVEEDRNAFRELVAKVFRGGSERLVFQIVGLKGTPRWLEIQALPLRDESGAVTSMLGITRDITEHKRMTEVLRQSEENLKRAQAVARIGSWHLDIPSNVLTWTAETYRIFGFPPGQPVMLEDAVACVFPEDREMVLEKWGAALRGAPHDVEHRIVVGDEIRWVRERAEVCFDAEGNAVSGIGTVQDITDRKRAEESQAEREHEFRTVLENVSDNIARYDREGRILYLNPQLERTLGFDVGDAVGKTNLELFPDGRFSDYDAALLGVIAGGEAAECDIVVPDTSAARRCHHVRITPERNDRGEVIGVLAVGRDVTDRKRMEEAVCDSRDFLHGILDGITHPILVKDRQHRWIHLNEAFCRLVGRTREELLGKSDFDYFPEHEARTFWQGDEAVFTSGRELTNEEEITSGTGEVRNLFTRKTLVADRHGRAVLVGIISDITERKRSEEALRASEERFRQAFEHAGVGMALVGIDGRWLQANRSLLAMLGYSEEELRERAFTEVTHPDDLLQSREAAERLLAGEIPFMQAEKRYRHRNGHYILGRLTRSVVRAVDGEPLHYISQIEDITERKRMAASLAEREREFRALVEDAPDNIARYDLDCRFLYLNPRLEETFGLPAGEVLGRTPVEVVPGEVFVGLQAKLAEVLETGRAADVEVSFPGPDGGELHHHVRFVADRGPAGDIIGALGIGRDVTERKMAEALLDGQKRVLELVAGGAPLAVSLTALVLLIEAHAPGMRGSVLLLDEEGLGLHHCAAPSLPPEYTAAIDGVTIGPQVGSCGTAAYAREAVFVEDIATDPLWNDYKEVALPHGLRACWSSPIFDEQRRVLGTFAMYYPQPALPQARHRRLIELATHTAEIAISHHRIAAALRTNEERLRLAVQASNVGLWDWDLRTDRTVRSREWKSQLGYEEHEIGTALDEWESRLHPEDVAPTRAAIAASHDGRQPEFAVEFRMRHKDGSYRWIFAQGEVIRDVDGTAVRMMGCHVDITERKRAEEKLAREQARLQFIFEFMPVGVALARWYPDGRLDRIINDAHLRICGLTREQDRIPGIYAKITHPDDLVRQAELCGAHNDHEGRDYSLEKRYVRSDGEVVWVLFFAQRKDYPDGSFDRLTGVVDITERKRTEEALRSSQEHLAAIIQSVDGIVWEADAETFRFTFVSPQAERLLGYPASRWIEEPNFWADNIHADDREQAVTYCVECTRQLLDHDFEYRMLAADGRVVWLRDIVTVVVENGRAVKLRGIMVDITERNRAEEALRNSREHLTALIQSVEGIVWEVDAETFRFTFVSPQAERLLGYPVSRWIEESTFWTNHIHPDDRERAVSYCGRNTREGRDHDLEYRMLAADGREVWLRDIVTVVVENDRPVKARGIMVDITAKKLAERSIQRLNRTYGVLSDINQLIVRERQAQRILDGACRIAVEVGGFRMAWIGKLDAATQIVKSEASSGVVDGYLDTVNIDLRDAERGAGPVARAHRTGEHHLCNDIASDPIMAPWREAALRRGYCSLAAFPLKIDGNVIGTFNLYAGEPGFFDPAELRLLDELAQDLAFALEGCEREGERRHMIEQVRASEERLRELAETVEEVFWITSPDKNQVLYISPAYEKIWGRSCQSLYDEPRSWLASISPDDRERILRAATTRQTEGSYDEEYRIVRPDGEIRWIRDRAFPVRNATGEVVRIVGVAQDITERRQLEDQFRQSQKLEAIGQLAGGVAHDFNNILLAILMQAEIAEMARDLPEEVREGLRQIRAASQRAANLTNQLLLFSRQQVMQPRELDLNEVVTSIARMLQRIIGEEVHLQLRLHATPLIARADMGMIDQVLLNLAVNARDAMSPGGGSLLIETGEEIIDEESTRTNPEATPGNHVWVSVRDSGNGIPPEILPHVFEPFFTTKDPGKGTGLGLATVFGIVKQHRGWIDIQSEPGKGTCFQIFLPASEASTSDVSDSERIASPPKPAGGTETVLLAEDDKVVRRGARKILERKGYRVLEASSGVQALELWQSHQDEVALLLTDLMMPDGMNGRQLAQRLQQDKPQLKVIFISGYSAGVLGREFALRSGENFLQKPFSVAEFLKAIRSCLDG